MEGVAVRMGMVGGSGRIPGVRRLPEHLLSVPHVLIGVVFGGDVGVNW